MACVGSVQRKSVVAIEGFDGTGKSALANHLMKSLGDRATIMHLALPDGVEEKMKWYETGNRKLTEQIRLDGHEVVILDRSWISGEVSRCATERDKLKEWPKDLYQLTHLFVLTLPEKDRLFHMERRAHEKPFTEEEIRLRDDSSYRDSMALFYQKACRRLRTTAVCRVFDGEVMSISQMADTILALLKVDVKLLDPRQLTTSDKFSLRDQYISWRQRESRREFGTSDHYKIIPDSTVAPSFSPEIKEKHKCHFDNLDRVFDYAEFSKPRHPPVSIGFLQNTSDFDCPFPADSLQAQDMPIAFPGGIYEYRIPSLYMKLEEPIRLIANAWHAIQPHPERYYAYLSISHGLVPPWQSLRRPSIHCDGFQSARVEPKQLGEYAFVASNALPTIFYIESFDTSELDPAKDDFFVHYSKITSKRPKDCQRPYEISMMDPYCLHAAVINATDEAVLRTFIRIQYSTRIYDRVGNAHNPAFDYQWEMVRREAQLDLIKG